MNAKPQAKVIDLSAHRARKGNNEGHARMAAWVPELNRLTGGLFNIKPEQVTQHWENGVCLYRKGGAA